MYISADLLLFKLQLQLYYLAYATSIFHFLAQLKTLSACLHCSLNFTTHTQIHNNTHSTAPIHLELLNTCISWSSLQRFNYFYMQFLSKWNGNHLKAVRPCPWYTLAAAVCQLATGNPQRERERETATCSCLPLGAAGHESAHKCG